MSNNQNKRFFPKPNPIPFSNSISNKSNKTTEITPKDNRLITNLGFVLYTIWKRVISPIIPIRYVNDITVIIKSVLFFIPDNMMSKNPNINGIEKMVILIKNAMKITIWLSLFIINLINHNV